MKFTKELKEMVEEQLLAKMTIAATKYEQSLPTEQKIDFMSYMRTCDRIGHHFSPKNGNLRLFINIRTLDRLLPHINKFIMEDPEVLKFEYHNEYNIHLQSITIQFKQSQWKMLSVSCNMQTAVK
jgi:hypothetical protein